MKNNKQVSPTKKLFGRPEKQTVTSHNSGSTIQTSDQKLVVESMQNRMQYQKSSKNQLQAISNLRKDIKNIKFEVTKLIQEGYAKTIPPPQWLESSANISSMSKSSKISLAMASEVYGQSDSKIRKSQAERSNYFFSYDELAFLKQECQNLKYLYKAKQQKQAEILWKQKQLLEEVKALRKCKQQLTKCIEILQGSLKQTNEQIRYHIEENKKLQISLQKSLEDQKQKQKDFNQISVQRNRLSEEVQYRKAENNELIRIIQIKESEVEQLKINYSEQIRAIQIHYRRAYQQDDNRSRSEDNYQRQRRSRSLNQFQPYSTQSTQIQKLQYQVQALRAQLQNRQKIMLMMLNDIKSMDKQLIATDEEHQELLRCRKLIQDLNQKLIKIEIKRVSVKYRYC